MVRFNIYTTPAGVVEPHWLFYYTGRAGEEKQKRWGATPGHEKEYGEIGPLAWLHAWWEEVASDPSAARPAHTSPPKAAVRRVVSTRRAELEEVCRRAGR